ncbi:MAG: type II toxin-antitoxin system HicA family toxin [Polyangiaceae bacterium]|nr:type II toxin-antitoxin system HicA family toxin [Polyangiaceae bacterium]
MAVRLRDLTRALATFGISVAPGKGSHQKFLRPPARNYPVPAPNGDKSEISDQYVKGVCRHFGLDEANVRALL